jgi:hypothetical protein
LAFVRIDQQGKNKFDSQPTYINEHDTTSSNKFTGIGPKITLESDFKLLRDIYVVAQAGLSALYGKSESKFNDGGITYQDQVYFSGSSYKEDNYQGAFGFEGKLGLAYAHGMNEKMAVRLEGGFKAQSYVNALQDEELEVGYGETPVFTAVDFDGTYSNFGPYINLSVDF